jgi:hypothetical protein
MARFTTGNTFNTGDQVTADTLNNAVNNAKVSTDSVDGSTIDINTSGGVAKLRVKTATGASDGVALSNIQHQPANTVLVRDANTTGAVSAKAVADTEILIGDGTGFTSAALSGDVTMDNAGAVTIANDAVTGDKISDSAALPDGVTATTQSANDNSTKVATTAYADSSRTPNSILSAPTGGLSVGDTGTSTLTGFTITNDGISVTESNGEITIPSGTYLITFGANTVSINNPTSSATHGSQEMKITRDGSNIMKSTAYVAGDLSSGGPASCSLVVSGGTTFEFRHSLSDLSGRTATLSGARVGIVKLA